MPMKKVLVAISVLFGLLSALVLTAACYYFAVTANVRLDPEKLEPAAEGFQIFDAAGEEMVTAARKDAPMQAVAKSLPEAFVAVEDKRFFDHHGLDILRMGKAALKNLASFSFREGASTISQQLIKNTHLSGEKTLSRKLKEIKLTRMLEKKYTKEQILERYLNTIYFGHSAFGISAASDFYFGKSPAEVTPAESAMLAALVRSPNNFSPFKNAEKCLGRRNFVLKCMREQGYLSEEEYEKALSEPLPVAPQKRECGYLALVYEELGEILGDSPLGGLKVYTACDLTLQSMCETLEAESDLAVLVRSTDGNAIKAYRSTCGDIARLPASTVKPLLVYAPAIEENLLSPATPLLDAKTDFGGYSPRDAGGATGTYMSARYALAHSVNIPAVKVLEALGIGRGADYLAKMGLHVEEDDKTLALALGGMKKGFSLRALADGYATLAKGGTYCRGGAITKITDEHGAVLYEKQQNEARVFSEETCFLVGDMLRSAVKEGTARRLACLPFAVSAKTGTGEAGGGNIDAYTVAYTAEDVVGVWLGNASGKPVTASGGGLPANFAKELLQTVYRERAPEEREIPKGVVRLSLDREAYEERQKLLLADPASPPQERFEEYFKAGAAPTETSTRFTRPTVQKPRIFVKNGCVSIVLCQTKYYDYVVKRENRGTIATIYEGNYCEVISDSSCRRGELYTYSVTPYYRGRAGETVVLPPILFGSGGSE